MVKAVLSLTPLHSNPVMDWIPSTKKSSRYLTRLPDRICYPWGGGFDTCGEALFLRDKWSSNGHFVSRRLFINHVGLVVGHFKLIYFSSIVKQVITTYLNYSRDRFLEPTSTGVIMRNHGRDPCGVRTHDPEVARRTPYPLGDFSP